ncbi:MAG: sigma-70 family RNA polymerase sigma factor [Ruminococcaceae bacterium]|nr:sigma-70 family RNA polymerase sigma factor [Oscillospiraceae bacterium]
MTKKDERQYEPLGEKRHASDETIVELYWQRDESAIQLTDEKYGKYLFTIGYNILRDRLDCEECLNDTYLGTWNAIPPSKPNPLQVFVSKIMRNTAVDRLRSRITQKRIPSEMLISLEELDECLSCAPTPAEEYDMRELASILNGYLRALSARQEFVFVCRYYYADTIESIARMLDVGEATVYRDLKAIRGGLKKCLEKEGFDI